MPRDVIGLMAAAVRDPDPVVFFEHKALMATKGDVPDGEIVDTLGSARVRRDGSDVTVVALAAMVPRALAAAEELAADGISAEVIDMRSLVPLDATSFGSRRGSAVASAVRATSPTWGVSWTEWLPVGTASRIDPVWTMCSSSRPSSECGCAAGHVSGSPLTPSGPSMSRRRP